ncbi:Tyrosine recombinase XerC [Corynebacterium diphtheriae]|nr:Tyrosine recombinase XerC [Corynebacterium diphtheriae]
MLVSKRPTLKPIPTEWELELLDFELFLRAQGRTPATIDTRIRHLRTFARRCGVDRPHVVTIEDFVGWSGNRDWAPETRNSYHASTRLFFQWRSLRHECEDPSILLKSIKRPVPPPRPAPDVAIREALSTPNERLKLILRLAAELGLRSAEIASIAATDIQPASDGWGILTVHGKGQKDRVLPIPPRFDVRHESTHPEPKMVVPRKLPRASLPEVGRETRDEKPSRQLDTAHPAPPIRHNRIRGVPRHHRDSRSPWP